jgi:hypothetical protein
VARDIVPAQAGKSDIDECYIGAHITRTFEPVGPALPQSARRDPTS